MMMVWFAILIYILKFIYLFILEDLFGDFEDLETGEKSKKEQDDDDQMDYDGKIKYFSLILLNWII